MRQSCSVAGVARGSSAPHHGVAADGAAAGDQRAEHRRQQALGGVAVDQQRLGGAADAGAAQLGVDRDRLRHGGVGGCVQVGVAVALEMGQHRDAALGHHPLDQRAPAARHDDVDMLGHAQQVADGGAVGGGHQLDRGGGQAGRGEARAEGGDDRARGVEALRAAAQDRGVAGLEAQRPGIGGDVGPALVDDPDHAQGHPHAGDVEAVGPASSGRARCRPGSSSAATVSRPSAMPATRLGFSSSRSSMAPDSPLARAAAMSRALAARIGGLALAQGGGGGQERRVLGGARGQRQHGGSGPGGLAQRQHLPLERVLQDGGHDALPRSPGRLSSKPAHAGQVVLGRAAPRRTSDVEACVRRRRRRLGQRR